jgi:hypothetical protein
MGVAASGTRKEVSENLHRADLTKLERAEHTAEWVKLTEEKHSKEVFGQPAQKPNRGRPEGGLSAAVKELGIERTEARRTRQDRRTAHRGQRRSPRRWARQEQAMVLHHGAVSERSVQKLAASIAALAYDAAGRYPSGVGKHLVGLSTSRTLHL